MTQPYSDDPTECCSVCGFLRWCVLSDVQLVPLTYCILKSERCIDSPCVFKMIVKNGKCFYVLLCGHLCWF